MHFDMAPTVSIIGNPPFTGFTARQLERDLASLTVINPITGKSDNLTAALADPVEIGLLHMITNDPARTPAFTVFGDPGYFLLSFGLNNPIVNPVFPFSHDE